ncbi:VOC family protein [Streptacidiphilus sp. EB129]|jgi:predicted enzyme related to lactoylglutathione lyase|uniref:VOC family protein n=1 Tax=Streptacidiphilus sp. EB129 TaxID=3156262 RepID=UPI003515C388
MSELRTARSPRVPCLPGTPSWISLLAQDSELAQDFYGPLLGWSFEAGPEQPGEYVYASVDGIRVAGIGSLADTGARYASTWTTFFGVRDVDAAARRVRERMGTVGVGPMDIHGGRIALAVDPSGAVFGLWQGRIGSARRLPMPGAPTWIELSTDAFAAALFYGDVLDWAAQDPAHLDVSWENERVVLRIEGHKFAALRTAPREAGPMPERPHWHVSFGVTDIQQATLHALRLGATLVEPPTTTPYGETASLQDPDGAPFSLTVQLVEN